MRELMSFAPAIGAGLLAIVSAYHTLTLAWSVGSSFSWAGGAWLSGRSPQDCSGTGPDANWQNAAR